MTRRLARLYIAAALERVEMQFDCAAQAIEDWRTSRGIFTAAEEAAIEAERRRRDAVPPPPAIPASWYFGHGSGGDA